MSFGYSVGDVIAVGNLAWRVWKSCRDAPESFKNVSQEVLSLHAVLKDFEELLEGQPLSESREARLATITDGCQNVLQDLQTLLQKYESLGLQTKRTWDRLRWHSDDIAELRARLISNAVLLNVYISSSQVFVLRQLDKFKQECKDGKREPSVITTQTLDSLSTDEKQAWHTIRKELEDIGISVAAFDANKEFIIGWLKEAIRSGDFEELVEDDSLSRPDVNDHCSSQENFDTTTSDHTTSDVATETEQSTICTPSNLQNNTNSKVTSPVAIQKLPSRKRPPRVLRLVSRIFGNGRELHDAINREDEETVRSLIASPNVDLECWDKQNRSPLSLAIKRENWAIVKLLLDANVHIAAGLDSTLLLSLAVMNNDEGLVIRLLEVGTNANDLPGGSIIHKPLYNAAKTGNVNMVRLLLESGADACSSGIFGLTPLYMAAKNRHAEVVRLLLEKRFNSNGNLKDIYIESEFLQITSPGYADIARLFLESKVNFSIDCKDKFNQTPLIKASENGDTDLVRLLVENGASVSFKNTEGETPLFLAVKSGHEAVVRLLVENGADVNCENATRITPLFNATSKEDEAIVRLLLEYGANVDYEDPRHTTPLCLAAIKGSDDIIKALLEKGADVNHIASLGQTPLHEAVRKRHQSTVWLLLENGAAIICADGSALPLSRAREIGYAGIAKLLGVVPGVPAK